MDKDGWYLETGPFHRENDDKPTDSGVPMSALVSNKPKRQDQRGKDFGRRWGPVPSIQLAVPRVALLFANVPTL